MSLFSCHDLINFIIIIIRLVRAYLTLTCRSYLNLSVQCCSCACRHTPWSPSYSHVVQIFRRLIISIGTAPWQGAVKIPLNQWNLRRKPCEHIQPNAPNAQLFRSTYGMLTVFALPCWCFFDEQLLFVMSLAWAKPQGMTHAKA